MLDVMERVYAALKRLTAPVERYDAGRAAGERWARDVATPEQVRRLAAAVGGFPRVFLSKAANGPAAAVAAAVLGCAVNADSPGGCDPAVRTFWAAVRGDSPPAGAYSFQFLLGFVHEALAAAAGESDSGGLPASS